MVKNGDVSKKNGELHSPPFLFKNFIFFKKSSKLGLLSQQLLQLAFQHLAHCAITHSLITFNTVLEH